MVKKAKDKEKKKAVGAVEADLCQILKCRYVGWEPLDQKIERFKAVHDFRICRRPNEGPIILSIKNNTATLISNSEVAAILSNFLEMFLKFDMPSHFVKFNDLEKVVKKWSFGEAHFEKLPKSLGFKSDSGIVMTRLDFDPKFDNYEKNCPLFVKMLEGIGNADALAMRLGSIYDLRADRKQGVWCYGPKDCGKSVIAWLAAQMAGEENTAYLDGTFNKDGHGKAALVRKRIATVAEAPARFIRSSTFKSLTGDARHPITDKWVKAFSAELDCLFFFASNEPPAIPHDDALMERIIACEMKEVPEEERIADYEIRHRLRQELPWIAGYCYEKFKTLEPGARIPCSREELEKVVDDYESEYLDFIEENFIIEDGAMMDRCQLEARLNKKEQFKNPREKHKIKRILEKRFKVFHKKITRKTNVAGVEKRVNVYAGIRERNAAELQHIKNEKAEAKELFGPKND